MPVSELEDICANCGKVGDEHIKLKKCRACHLVKYCNVTCQRAHRPIHKNACKKRAAELREESLFTQPLPEPEECPVCCLRMPFEQEKICYKACCGKVICSGCELAHLDTKLSSMLKNINRTLSSSPYAELADMNINKALEHPCPFCRTPCPTRIEDEILGLEKRADKGDPRAMWELGIKLMDSDGVVSFRADPKRAKELLLRAAELGDSIANLGVGVFYYDGKYPALFPQNAKRAWPYLEAAALAGNPIARAYLGQFEMDRFRLRAAYRHMMIAASGGYQDALDNVQNGFKNGSKNGLVSKEEFAKTLRAYQAATEEMKSEQRTKSYMIDCEKLKDQRSHVV